MYDDLYEKAQEKVESIHEGTFKDKTETIIYDNTGKVMREVAIHDYHYIPHEDLQPFIIESLLAIEDIRFYEHEGYDLKAIMRATVELVKNKGEITQGGSTITQQLVKLQFLTLEKSYSRKIEEIIIASELEKLYSKEQILEFYLNNVNYGNGAYGIETASYKYFNKPSSELTLSEIAFLTAIPNNPTYYNPVKNMENTLERRNLILKKMLEYGFINEKAWEESRNEKIVLSMKEKEVEPENYAISFALSSATKLLMEQEGFEFQYWFDTEEEREEYWASYNEVFVTINKRIRNGGYQIHTTLNNKQQELLQESLNNELAKSQTKDAETGLYTLQGASVTIDNQTGDVVAIVGGRTQEDINNTFNRAFLSSRQPGSTIKPLIVYTPAFERDKIASSKMVDKPIDKGPLNANRTYLGTMDMREAVERSTNTIPFQILEEYTPKEVIPYLEKMEFSHLSPRDNHIGISVGGFTYGTNVLEMAGAYSTIARNGEYIKPTGITKIIDYTNTVLYEKASESRRVYDSGSSFLMTDVMKGVMTSPVGTGRGYALSHMTTAGKSGSTNDNKDIWFAGYTPYYTNIVWVGEDIPKTLYDIRYAKNIWKDYMETLHESLDNVDFPMPKGISYMYVNPNTGKVSKTNEHGWWRKELVTDLYYELQIKQEAIEERERMEAMKLAEEQRRKERLAQLDGISEEEELRREKKAEDMLYVLRNSHINGTSDIEYVYKLMEEVKQSINMVKIIKVRDAFYAEYHKEVKRIEEQRYQVENPPPLEEPEPVEPIVEADPIEIVEEVEPPIGEPVNEEEIPVEMPEGSSGNEETNASEEEVTDESTAPETTNDSP